MNFELAFKAQFEGPLMMIRHDGMAIEGGGGHWASSPEMGINRKSCQNRFLSFKM